jgi:hypothetical protein
VNNYNAGTVTVLLGDGDGGFRSITDYDAGLGSTGIAVGALRDAGVLDIVTVVPGSAGVNAGAINVLQGNGDGTFAPLRAYPPAGFSGPGNVQLADMNRDGVLDAVVVTDNPAAVEVFRGDGGGGLAYGGGTGLGSVFLSALAVADFNADGINDVAAVDVGSAMGIAFGKSNGGLNPLLKFPVDVNQALDIAVADLNSDGFLDVVVAGPSQGISVLLGRSPTDGGAAFAAPAPYDPAGASAVALGDLDGDGALDLVACTHDNFVYVVLGNRSPLGPDGTFQYYGRFPAGQYADALAIADFNNDGRPDIAVANLNDSTVSILLNNFPPAAKPLTCSTVDVDGGTASPDGGTLGGVFCGSSDPLACRGYETAGAPNGYDPCGPVLVCAFSSSHICIVGTSTSCTLDSDCSNMPGYVCQCPTGSSPCTTPNTGVCRAVDGTPCDDDKPSTFAYACTTHADCSAQNSAFTECHCPSGSAPCATAGSGFCSIPTAQTCTKNSDCAGNLCLCASGGFGPCDALGGTCGCNGGPAGYGGETLSSMVPALCNNVCVRGRCTGSFSLVCQ